MSDSLGPFRDGQTSIKLLEREFADAGCLNSAAWTRLMTGRYAAAKASLRNLQALCSDSEFTRRMATLDRFLDCDLPEHAGHDRGDAFASFSARKLRKACRKLWAQDVRPFHTGPEDLHELRKTIRRIRYLAEFATPVLGSTAADAARLMKRLADALGDVHDLDVLLEQTGPPHASLVPPALRAHAMMLRLAALRSFEGEWLTLTSEKFANRIDSLVKKV
jgi:CHAD domain-containing protein